MSMVMRPRLRRRTARGQVPAEAIAFQNDLDVLVNAPAPLLLRLWPALGALLFVSLLGLAAFTRVDIVVTASGRIVPDIPPVVMQPLESGILRELRVRPGEVVVAGQILAVFDPTFTVADRTALDIQRQSLAAQRDRLEAELAGTLPPPPVGDEALLQEQLHAQRAALHTARRASIDADLRALEGALRAEREAQQGAADQLAIAREVEQMRGRLVADQVGSRLSLLGARAARLEVEQQGRRSAARIAELTEQLAARRAERDVFLQDWRRMVLEELARIRPELAQVDERLAKARRRDALTSLRAPRAGVVLEVARRAPGSLVREGEAVVVLVPSDVPLIGDVVLRSADIGRLAPGAPVVLKIDAFPWRRYGTLSGTLRSVSRESYQASPAAGSAALHRGQIALRGSVLAAVPVGDVLPGMTLVAEINVGTRSVLDFFLEPLLRGLRESLREP